MNGVVHVVGGGVAGLSAATALAERGFRVIVYEAAPQAGGRCRSFLDDAFGATVDNGTHLVLSGNRAVARYLRRTGATDRLTVPERARFPFADMATGERWALDLGAGRLPFGLLFSSARIPGTRIADYLSYRRVLAADDDDVVAATLSGLGQIYRRFWEPFALAVLNTPPDEAAAGLLAPVLRETVLRGGRACLPMIAPSGLSDAFVGPALAYLEKRGGRLMTGHRLRAVERNDDRAGNLRFADADVPISADDSIVLAVPAWVAADLVPGLVVPDSHEPIVNAHFAVAPGRVPPAMHGKLTGVIGGTAEWMLARDDQISVTVSAARRLVERPAGEIAERLWRDVVAVAGFADAAVPVHRVIKERRATFSQTPTQCRRRPTARDGGPGVILAGDWTATGLPATIEGALRSGETAAEIVSGG